MRTEVTRPEHPRGATQALGGWAGTDPTVTTRGQQTLLCSARSGGWCLPVCRSLGGRPSFNSWGPLTQTRGGNTLQPSPLLNREVLFWVFTIQSLVQLLTLELCRAEEAEPGTGLGLRPPWVSALPPATGAGAGGCGTELCTNNGP